MGTLQSENLPAPRFSIPLCRGILVKELVDFTMRYPGKCFRPIATPRVNWADDEDTTLDFDFHPIFEAALFQYSLR